MPVTITIPVPYVPDGSTAALKLTEGGTTSGPYPAAVTQAGGVYSLSVTTSDPIIPESASVQPGSWPLPQTDPTAFLPIGLPLPGTLFAGPAGDDIDFAVGPAVFDITEQTATAEVGTGGFLHFPVTMTLSATGAFYDPTGGAVQVALTQGVDPGPADWLHAAWLTRSAGPGAGLYAALSLSGLTRTAGRYRGYVQTAGDIRRAPNFVLFE